ncbi:MAG: hypothetical protein ACHQ50_00830 [Fimbriimonadales bacterium]
MDKPSYVAYLHEVVTALETSLTNSVNQGPRPGSEVHQEALRRQLSIASGELEDVLTSEELTDCTARKEALALRLGS